jgi:hypothetical protein
MDLAWFRSTFAWSLLGKLSGARDMVMFVAVMDDDHASPMISVPANGRRFGVFR